MANKIKEIKNFFSGIVSSFSSSDIPDDNASFSLNIDSSEKDGVLKGSKKELDLINAVEIDANVSKVLESEDNKFDLVYSDAESGDVKVISDLYGAKTLKTPIGASGVAGSAESIEVKNDKVYIGHGKNIKPKILYKTKKIPFQKESETLSDWIYEDSTLYDRNMLNSSFSVDRFINFPGAEHSSYTSAIGIRYDHKDIYYIDYDGQWTDVSNNIFDLSDGNTKIHFGNTEDGRDALSGAACDICQAEVNEYADGVALGGTPPNNTLSSSHPFKVWILSINHAQSESTSGVPQLQKFRITENPGRTRGSSSNSTNKGSASHEGTYLFEYENGEIPPQGAIPGSILETKNYLWVQYWKPSGDKFTRDENFLYCVLKTEIPATGGSIVLTNKSLKYDKIRKKRAKIHFGNKNLTHRHRETYFYNSDMPWKSLKTGNWLRGSENWSARTSSRGQHYYSGIYCIDGEPGFSIVRHGLIQSPITDKENPDFDAAADEDWVAVMSSCDDQMINIYSAQSYRVAGGWNWHSYHKLRATDDFTSGSENEGGAWGIEWISKIFNILQFVFTGQAALDYLAYWKIGCDTRNNIAKTFGWLYGDEDLNFYYNGKCFETGLMSTQLINISSNHVPSAKLNLDDGARVQIRELYGFNKNLEVICVKHYMDRLMISCHDPSQEDKYVSTLFFMYNTSDNSVTETNKVQIAILDDEDENLDEDWREGADIPPLYTNMGSSADIGHSHPNKILQLYIPVTDLNFHNYGAYPELFADINDQVREIYPHLNGDFFVITDEVSAETSYLWNKNQTGDIFYTQDAIFDIYRTGLNVFDGQKTRRALTSGDYGIGYSHQETNSNDSNGFTEGDHISFMSTSGPFNVSKFNFKIVSNTSESFNTDQLGIPVDSDGNSLAEEIFPNDPIAILSLNQAPNASDDINIKQYALDAKTISFNVKAHPYDGLNIPPFIHNIDDGRELYRYKINLVYDGYQDSPLCTHYTQVDIRDLNVRHTGDWSGSTNYDVGDQAIYNSKVFTCTTATSGEAHPESNTSDWEENNDYRASALAVTINLHKPEIISRRVTHIRLWRSRCELNEGQVTGDDVYTIEQAYTLVDTIPLESNWNVTNEAAALYNSSSTDNTLGNIAMFTAIDNGNEGVSFEASTGMPEAVKVYQPNYTLSTQLLSYLFVADCKHPSFEDATNLIFRSQPDRYNTFDWSRDFVSIPSTPKAMTSFNSRIIVWDFNNMYVINPGSLYIEDTFEGTGCLNSTSFERTEFGICFADENNIYMYDGQKVQNIGVPIVTSHKQGLRVSWKDRDPEYNTHIKFEADKRCFCIFFRITGDFDYNWLLRGIKAQHYDEYKDLDSPPLRWYEIPGANANFIAGENQFRYVWHLDMWKNQFQNTEVSSYADYVYNVGDKNITLPYGTGYDLQQKHYIVDLQLFTKGEDVDGILDNYSEEELLGNSLFILQKDDYPNYANVITNGKFDMENIPSYYFYTYNIDKNRWDLQETSKYKGVINGPKGEIYSSMITREESVLDVGAISDDVIQFNTYGENPLGGKGNIIEELSLNFQNMTPVSDSITSMKFGPQLDGYELFNGSINGLQWYRKEVGQYENNRLYEYFIDMEITRDQEDSYWSENSKSIFESIISDNTYFNNSNDYKSMVMQLVNYDGQTRYDVDIVGGNIDEIKIYIGHTMNFNSEEAVLGLINSIIDSFSNSATWNTPGYINEEYPISNDNLNDDDYIEVTSSSSHNLSVGDVVKITEVGAAVTDENSLGSPFKNGLNREIYYVNGNKFRFKVTDNEEYFNTAEWGNDVEYLSRWREHLDGNPWPHSDHHGSASWELQEDWMLDLSIGDLNRDGGINIQDVIVAQEGTYIIIKGNEFETHAYYVNNYKYYPDIYIIDETAHNNYHKLRVIWCYTVEISPNNFVSYLLLENKMYEQSNTDNDYGWNESSDYSPYNQMPENTLVILNNDAIVLPGEPGLKQLFGSQDSQRFTYISKNFSFENQTTNKILSKVKIIYQNTKPSFQYMINDNKQWIIPDETKIVYEENCLYYQVPLKYKKAKTFKIKIISNSSSSNVYNYDTEVDSFSIIYRERGNA